MGKMLFYMKLGYRNLVRGRWKTILLGLSLFIGLTTVLIFANVFPMVKSSFIGQAIERYGDIDVYVTYDANSNTRFLSQRPLIDQFGSEVEFAAPYFNFFGIIEVNATSHYTQILSSYPNGQRFIGLSEPLTLRSDEALVTQSFSDEYHLSVNDGFIITIGSNQYPYIIREILPDYGIFRGDSIFIDKQSLLEKIVAIPNLDNIGNTLYIRLNHQDSEGFVHRLVSSQLYSGFVINEVLNETEINQSSTYTASILMAMCLFGVLALGYVIHSFVPLFYREFSEQVGVIQSLGGDKKITIRIWLMQFVILLLIIIPLSLLTTRIIFQEGIKRYQISMQVSLDVGLSMLGIFAFLVFLLFDLFVQTRPLFRSSVIHQVTDKRHLNIQMRWLSVLIGILFGLISVVNLLPQGWNALLQIIAMVVIIFWLIDSVFHLWNRYWKSHPRYSGLISIPLLATSKAYHTAMKISVLSIMVLLLSLSSRSFLRQSFPILQEQIKVDYLLVNLFNYQSATKDQIASHPEVADIDEAVYQRYLMIDVVEKPKRMAFHLSMDYHQLSKYLSFTIQGNDVERQMTNPNQLAVLLPYSIVKSHQKSVGDEIIVDFPHPIGRKSCVIAGLIDTDYDNIIISNLLIYQSESANQSINALLVLTSSNSSFEQDMIRQYGSQMMGVIAMDRLLASIRNPIFDLFDFVIFIIMMIIVAFGFVIWMNAIMVYHQFQGMYAMMISMGLSKQRLTRYQLVEFVLMSLAIVLSVLLLWLIAFPKIPDLLLLVGYYKFIPSSISQVSVALLIGIGLYFIGFGYCLVLLRKLDIIQTLKLN